MYVVSQTPLTKTYRCSHLQKPKSCYLYKTKTCRLQRSFVVKIKVSLKIKRVSSLTTFRRCVVTYPVPPTKASLKTKKKERESTLFTSTLLRRWEPSVRPYPRRKGGPRLSVSYPYTTKGLNQTDPGVQTFSRVFSLSYSQGQGHWGRGRGGGGTLGPSVRP